MKQVLKIIFSLLLGACIGCGAVMLYIVLFTDIMPSGFLEKVEEIQASKLVLSCLLSLISLILAIFLQVILHEGGHLLLGFVTGYRFVSIRIVNLTKIK